MADVESKPARKKRSFDEKEINLLISQWSEYPCLFDKTNPDHKDQNKRADVLHDFSGPTNRHDKSQRVNRPLVLRVLRLIKSTAVVFEQVGIELNKDMMEDI